MQGDFSLQGLMGTCALVIAACDQKRELLQRRANCWACRQCK